VQHDAGVERDQPLGRREQRIDVDLADRPLLDDELAEADEQILQSGNACQAAQRTPSREWVKAATAFASCSRASGASSERPRTNSNL